MKYLDEIDGTVIDRNQNPGVTSTMKTYISYSHNELLCLNNAGCDPVLRDNKRYFSVCMVLPLLLDFCEHFTKVIVYTKLEQVLIRSRSNMNDALSSIVRKMPKVVINKMIWKVADISLRDAQKLQCLPYINKGSELPIGFRL